MDFSCYEITYTRKLYVKAESEEAAIEKAKVALPPAAQIIKVEYSDLNLD